MAVVSTKLGNERTRLLQNLFSTYACLYAQLQHRLDKTGLTIPQYNALIQLFRAYPEPLTAGQLKERMLFPNTDLTRLGDRLLQKRLISREVNPQNRRQIYLRLTPEAFDDLQLIVAQWPNYESILDGLSPAEIAIGNQLFQKIKDCISSQQ